MEQFKPKVSIIIPVYNTEKYLRECLDSVVNQTLKDIEIICVDDGSTDGSLTILREYAEEDHRFKVLIQDNSGSGPARTLGIREAHGDFLAFMDADDYYPENDTLQKLYSKAKEQNVLICGGSLCTVKNGKKKTKFDFGRSWGFSFPIDTMVLYEDYQFDFGFYRFIYNRVFLIDNEITFPAYRRVQDPPFFIKAMCTAKQFYAIHDLTYCYRESGNYQSITADRRKVRDCLLGYTDMLNLAKANDLHSLYCLAMQRAFGGSWRILEAARQIDEPETDEALDKLVNAVDISFWDPDANEAIAQTEKLQYIRQRVLEETSFPSSRNGHEAPMGVYVRYGSSTLSLEEQPAVSVIIPVYNVEPYLQECLDSIVNQTLREIEIICVNDGSTDGSLSILEEYQQKDSRITIVSQNNRGLSAARNSGMRYAHGTFIDFIDSDDYLELNALETAYRIAMEENLDIVLYERESFYESEEMVQKHPFHINSITEASEVLTGVEYMKMSKEQHNFIMTACFALWRQALLRDNHISFKEGIVHEDNLYSFQAYMAAKRLIRIPDKFYHRRVRTDSIMTLPKSSKNVIGYFSCAEGVLSYALNGPYAPDKEREICRAFQEMTNTAKSIYRSLSLEEQDKVVFPREVENKLFQQIIGSEYSQETVKRSVRLQHDLDAVHNSLSYRIGRGITWLPRKIRGGIRCYKKHGLRYTVNRVLIHMHLKKDPKKAPKKDYAYYSSLAPSKYPKELKLWYKRVMKQDLDLDNPKTFNEKIQWMKLYDATPLKTRLADKYLVRDWVKEKIGEEYLVPLLGVWDSFDEIDFDKLPDQFALKANHGSGWNIIVKDKSQFDKAEAKKKFDKWLRTNFAFCNGFELQYMNIPPKIIAEQFIENAEGLKDYRFYCFNGKPAQVWVDIFSGTPNHLRSVFDMDWNPVPLKCTWPEGGDLLSKKPQSFEKMKEFAARLSQDFAFVRVDFFDVDGKLYMGEMTFTPMSGTGKFEPLEWDKQLGDLLVRPPKSPIPTRQFQ